MFIQFVHVLNFVNFWLLITTNVIFNLNITSQNIKNNYVRFFFFNYKYYVRCSNTSTNKHILS